jgi:hypothetical protein
MEAHELIDRYIHEVGQHLPRSNRDDIKLELRSLLLDTIEEQTADSGQPPTTKIVAEYLREFGSPEEIASKYSPEQVLIGSQLFPLYKLVLTIVLTVMGAFHLLGLILPFIQNDSINIGRTLLDLLFSYGQTAFFIVGIVTLIFAVLERLQGVEFQLNANKDTDWDPLQLPPVEDPDRIDRFEIVAGIFFAALFIIALNFFYDWIGVIDLTGDDRGVITLLAPEFRQHVPWLSASFALDALLKLVVLAQGRWNRGTRLVQLATEGFGIFVLYRILVSDVIAVVPLFTTIAKGIIIMILVIEAFELVGILTRVVVGRPISPKYLPRFEWFRMFGK